MLLFWIWMFLYVFRPFWRPSMEKTEEGANTERESFSILNRDYVSFHFRLLLCTVMHFRTYDGRELLPRDAIYLHMDIKDLSVASLSSVSSIHNASPHMIYEWVYFFKFFWKFIISTDSSLSSSIKWSLCCIMMISSESSSVTLTTISYISSIVRNTSYPSSREEQWVTKHPIHSVQIYVTDNTCH